MEKLKEIFDEERWIGSYDSTYQHSDGHTAEVLYSAHNYSIDRLEQAVADHVSGIEAKMDAYRLANESKAERIEKMKEQYEEDARNWRQDITDLEALVPKVVTPKKGVCDCGTYCMHNCERTSYCPNCGSKINWD